MFTAQEKEGEDDPRVGVRALHKYLQPPEDTVWE